MNFPSIDIQGSILSADLLGKIRSEQSTFQQGKDFNPTFTNAKLKDEISLAWQDAKGQWTIFQNKLKRVGEDETASTETRSFWILPLLPNLGYDFQYLKSAEELNGKSFWINNRDNNIGGFPLFIAGYNESLDRRSENKTLRVSPHALVQEYLNYSEHWLRIYQTEITPKINRKKLNKLYSKMSASLRKTHFQHLINQ